MSVLKIEQHGTWKKLILNRPDQLNSFDAQLKEALLAALHDAANDSLCRALLITGSGRGFCAGQDLRAITGSGPKESFLRLIEDFYNPLILGIRSMSKPVICAVNGVAAGAGANLALACDIVLAARSARFIQAFSKIGLSPDAGGSWLLPKLIGDARARALIMLGRPISAEQAESWGMIWKAVDDASLEAEAHSLVEELASGPTRSLANTKKLLNQSFYQALDDQLRAEALSQDEMGNTADHAEGVAAFLAKRKPDFSGQ